MVWHCHGGIQRFIFSLVPVISTMVAVILLVVGSRSPNQLFCQVAAIYNATHNNINNNTEILFQEGHLSLG